ncbi:cell division protein FtsK [Pseudomonas aeruginosa]|uniref:cell division protein FtsK n=1 Tax=Pseudomonas aeruginosa TaxID=287 RepID=UPI0019207E5B|nr:cell division protein FtsK [Pseudomonas aeruginosa]MBX5729624.1 cell division protein FtsK [Pseudomonas aeruginosa]MBX5777847.1 cell division protein FtsK [Pseudomonas aeruginosa]MBX6299483.1 cell division protein FtsK [Pseudomonas aeruginosa]MBX6793019.1 cell division protein FtsK [Pseudomonas aeruginosa]MBX6800710.1 cell division protein FtsK [Pseudomonas aeruginosa]
MSQNNAAFLHMTADTLGKSLLQGLIQEIRIMPDCWQKLPEAKQQDIIDRLERQVRNAATIAVHTIAGGDRDTVYGKLESMTAKDKMKAVFVVNPSSPHKEDLLFAVNKDCLLIIGGAAEFLDGMKDVKADPDQNPLDLNGGDHDMEDPGAWGGMQPADDSDVVDAEFQELPQLTVERFAGHTLGEIAIGVATKKDVFDAAWLQSRFALTTEEAERVVLQLLDQGVIVLEQENEESRELNTYRVIKKPGDIALDLE